MEYKKIVKALKQGGTTVNLPKSFCDILNIMPGAKLELSLDFENKSINIRKIEE